MYIPISPNIFEKGLTLIYMYVIYIIFYTIVDFLLSKYGLIFTEFESIDLGSALVNTIKFNKYRTIFIE